MSIPLLPSLKEENKIAITKRGQWASDNQTSLSGLVDGLKVTADAQSNITSIPDLWARPAMYEMVLFDEKHHLHNKYLAEWRGILAMLALRDMRNFKDIKKEEIILPEISKIPANSFSFFKVIASLLPDEYKKYKDNTIDSGYKLQILTYAERALAIIWPTILVCPAIGLDKMIDRSVSWWNVDGISDPVSSISEQEKALLKKWLDKIKDDIIDYNTSHKEYKLEKTVRLLDDFQNDLETNENPTNYSLGTGLKITGFCQCIDKAIKCKVDAQQFLAASNVRLINRRGIDAKNLLVMTPDMYKQWNRAASDIVVAGNINLDSALPYGGVIFDKEKINGEDLSPFNAELRTGEDFFTEKICLIEGSGAAFPNSLYKEPFVYRRPQNILLPIKRELLNYLSPEYIVKNFRISVVNDVDIKVELDLPLSGFSEEGEILTIQKVYKGNTDAEYWKRDIVDDLALPLIQIWPNFIPNDEKNWQAYYSYYDTLGSSTFAVEPLWNESVKRKVTYDGGFYAEIVKGKTFPEGYACTAEFQTTAQTKNIEIGLILLAKPDKLQLQINNNCKLGIDFGTTNTVAYMSMHDKTDMIRFRNRLYSVTDYNDAIPMAELRRHFFTVSEQPNGDAISIRTLFNPNIGEFKGDLNQPVFPGVVYYLDSITNIEDDKGFTNLIQGKEMKWDTAQGIDYMKYFILHMGLQCLAEAVANGATNIEWYYSYPGAFSELQIGKLQQIWSGAVKIFQKICPTLIAEKAVDKSESTSMAEFFKGNMQATLSRGIACFDIGGGSTDIAIWRGLDSARPKGQCSLRFAGNNILNQQLFKNKQILQYFTSNDSDFNKNIQALCVEDDYKKFNMNLEALLKYHETTLFKSLVSTTVNKDVKLFIRNIAFALSGIFFYAGMIIGNLRKNNELGEDLPHCYIGGNGSKLLDWVDNGNYDCGTSNTFESVYTTCLAMGVGVATKSGITKHDLNFGVNKSSKPKEEVAYGLVCRPSISLHKAKGSGADDMVFNITDLDAENFLDGLLSDENEGKEVLAGEKFYLAGEKIDKDYITVQDIRREIKIDPNMPTFKLFVKGFNALIAKKGYSNNYQVNFSDANFENIRDQANDEFANQALEDEEKITLEPPFIVILRQALASL
ncbi:MAG: hypothetical protein Q4E64_08685 [Phascolarctobacterium sp.]|uniref:hypothetical protein n=1 Tax=Phascolarctobacterium sp. TaxID=2049039 RepID=UPI0026DD88B6|nr:hypothetical protein [Phascolarctobacterium sp.]MDO4921881.1 hypothetical protein [Phascolarctobacterium sp.]